MECGEERQQHETSLALLVMATVDQMVCSIASIGVVFQEVHEQSCVVSRRDSSVRTVSSGHEMTRYHDWEKRLDEYLTKAKTQTFSWGSFDCALFVCGAVASITGVDMGADFRGKYDSCESAAEVMQAYAGGGLEQLAEKMADTLHLSEVPKFMAQRGDVVLFDTDHGPALGIVSLDGWNVLSTGQELKVRTLNQCRRAWHIG
jgi:hypothetical protein